MTASPDKLAHLEWAVNSRARNQRCCLELFKLFDEFSETWRTKKYSRAAQELVAIAFSLWRAAFLAEKTGNRGEVFAHGRTFLGKIVEDNAIAYAQDKSSREWTFNYYTRNARYSLEFLNEFWPDQVPLYEGDTRTAVQRWDYCQTLLDQSVENFGALLREKKTLKAERTSRRAEKLVVRKDAKKRRAASRKITLASRQTNDGS